MPNPPSMNTVIQQRPDTGPQGHSNEVSRANVFVIFLTLAFCLSTQPPGSLFYSPQQGRFKSIIFRMWRMNPLACFVEAIIILEIFGKVAWRLWKDGARGAPIWVAYRRTATALLLLRARRPEEDGFRVVDGLSEAPEEPQAVPDTVDTIGRTTTSTVILDESDVADAKEPDPGATNALNTAAVSPNHRIIGRRATPTCGAMAIPSAQSPSETLSRSQHTLLKHALRSSALFRRGLIVDVIGIVSLITTVAKLAATTLPWNIRLPACFMICGWTALQVLLVLSHSKEIEHEEMNNVLEAAQQIKSTLWPAALDLPNQLLRGIVLSSLLTSIYLSFMLVVPFAITWMQPSALFWVVVPITLWRFAQVPFNSGWCKRTFPRRSGALLNVVALAISIWGTGRLFSWAGAPWYGCIGLPILLAFRFPGLEAVNGASSWGLHGFLTGSILYTTLLHYSPSGTYKPDWLDWLG